MITEIFSRRQRKSRGEFPDVYQYDTMPESLRRQAIYIFEDFFESVIEEELYDHLIDNDYKIYPNEDIIYECVCSILVREYGVIDERHEAIDTFFGSSGKKISSSEFTKKIFFEAQDTERAIDVIELLFQYIKDIQICFLEDEEPVGDPELIDLIKECTDLIETAKKDTFDELNVRFREHGIGYRFEPGSGQIIRIDSEYIHSEVVCPTLSLLTDPIYKSANDEFLNAHKAYRNGDYKSCISECSNAFESVLKIICANNGWASEKKKPTSKDLLDTVYKERLLPIHTKSFFNGVRAGLEHGIPATRNEIAAHGQGNKEVSVPIYMAEYMINITGSAIVLLIKASPSERDKILSLMEEKDIDEQMLSELEERLNREEN